MKLEDVQVKNPNFWIRSVEDTSFKAYGKVVEDIDFTPYIEHMENVQVPSSGNVYEPSIEAMEKLEVTKRVQSSIYGEMPIQVGYCNGHNRLLNGLEYHKGSETLVAVTDLILMLGKISDIENNSYHASKIAIFFVPKGTVLELYQTTLHFSPCEVVATGFKALIILPKGTNLPLENDQYTGTESEILFKKNKWLMVHESHKKMVEQGAYVGIMGQNIGVNV